MGSGSGAGDDVRAGTRSTTHTDTNTTTTSGTGLSATISTIRVAVVPGAVVFFRLQKWYCHCCLCHLVEASSNLRMLLSIFTLNTLVVLLIT